MAAEAFGADRTWFLVNGTSGGIHAAVMAACTTGAEFSRRTNAALRHRSGGGSNGGSNNGSNGAGLGGRGGEGSGHSCYGAGSGHSDSSKSSSGSSGGMRPWGGGVPTLIAARNCHLAAVSAMTLAGDISCISSFLLRSKPRPASVSSYFPTITTPTHTTWG